MLNHIQTNQFHIHDGSSSYFCFWQQWTLPKSTIYNYGSCCSDIYRDILFTVRILLRHLEYRRPALRNQDHRHHPRDVESGQVTGRLKPATLSMLKLYYVQIDESSVSFSSGCVICLDDFQKGESCCVVSSCKHVFHSGCFMQWLDKNQSCPLCRNPVWWHDSLFSWRSHCKLED